MSSTENGVRKERDSTAGYLLHNCQETGGDCIWRNRRGEDFLSASLFPWQERLVELATGACWGGELEQMVKAGEERLKGKTVRFRRD